VVRFRVNGYPDTSFVGKVRRVDAPRITMTRQVEVLVDFARRPPPPRPCRGLYAEGRIAAGRAGR
jgi:hypothetical protein